MAEEMLHVERHDNGVVVLRLDRPKVNALCMQLMEELRTAADALTDEPPGAVVVTGGDRIFAAGADISEFGGPEKARQLGALFSSTFEALSRIPRVVIAEVGGVALGGGCELAMACDLRVASDRARFGQPEILLGIIPGAGGTQRLARLVGPSRAKDLVLSGRQIDAEEALRIGLVDRVVPSASLRDEVMAMAAEYARGPLAAQALAKRAIDDGLKGTLAEGLIMEQEAFVEVFGTEDARTGLASFLEYGPGKATFSGR